MAAERTRFTERPMTSEFLIKRILVALDASPHSLAALEEAAGLAQRLEAELVCLFVEDANLLRLAGLPLTPGFNLLTAARQDPDLESIERELRALAGQVRKAVEETGRRRGVAVAFRVARGGVAAELIAAGDEADLLIIGRRGHGFENRLRLPHWSRKPDAAPRRERIHLGMTARRVAAGARHSVLLIHRGAHIAGPLMVAYDGSPGAERALAAAARIAGRNGSDISVLALGDSPEARHAHGQQAQTWLDRHHIAGHVLHMEAPTPGRLCSLLTRTGSSVLVIHADNALASNSLTGSGQDGPLVDRIDCPVLLVR